MFDIPDKKSFMDSVHGYIQIPRCFVENIIDTPEYQRLRFVDQTGMKVLFPTAKHDRFSHSLGVYYLGTIAVDALLSNFKWNQHWNIRSDNTKNVFWAKNKVLFLIACLLHDIGHSPFSHSLESFFEHENYLDTEISKKITGDNDLSFCNAKPHEKMSAWLILKERSVWKNRIKKILIHLNKIKYPKTEVNYVGEYDLIQTAIDAESLDEDIQFIARMILGLKYTDFRPEFQMRNCFIELLNGNYDVDKLDYTIRDTKMSGISNIALDVERLLNSITIIPSTVYVDTVVDLSAKGSVVICDLKTKKGTLTINGFLDKPLNLRNCELIIANKTKINYFYPKEEPANVISYNGYGKINNSANISINHHQQEKGPDCTSIGSFSNGCLSMENAEILEDLKLKIGDSVYNLMLDEKKHDNQIEIISSDTSLITIDSSVILSGSIRGNVNYLKVLSDELHENQEPPTANKYNGFSLGYNKQAVNLLSNVTDARNYLYLWIYSHHKVAYYANYLIVELSRLSSKVATSKSLSKNFFEILMSEDAWKLDETFIHNNIREMYDHFKKQNGQEYKDIIKLCNELITRAYRCSVYKSLAEFDLVFYKFNTPNSRKDLRNFLEEISELYDEDNFPKKISNPSVISKMSMLKYGKFQKIRLNKITVDDEPITKYIEDIVWVSSNPSLSRPSPSTIYITLSNLKYITTIDRLAVLNFESEKSHDNCYFYLYYRLKKGLEVDSETRQKINRSIVSYLERMVLK